MFLNQKSNKASCWIATENSLTRSYLTRNFIVQQWNCLEHFGLFARQIFAIFSTNRKRFVSKIAKICLAKIPKCSWPVSLLDNKISCRKTDCAGRESKEGNKYSLFFLRKIIVLFSENYCSFLFNVIAMVF